MGVWARVSLPIRDQSLNLMLSEVVTASQIAVKNDPIRPRNVVRRERLHRRASVGTARERSIFSGRGELPVRQSDPALGPVS
ncbi:MAG: hypothetical protein JWM11_2344 [Planctomycetaceae bacterium]|nr:hypothetical protein [Planctomycetaceae bacterium]